MSWFYDALKRMEQEQTAHGAEGPAAASNHENSLLSSLASVISVSDRPSARAVPVVTELSVREDTHDTETSSSVAVLDPAMREIPVQSNPARAAEPDQLKFRRISIAPSAASRLVFDSGPHSLAAEHYRMLRQNLSREFRSGATLMITSPGEGDGKTLTALNLCSSLADRGDSVLLVELDVRHPAVSRTLGCSIEAPGIESALRGMVMPHEAICFIEEISVHAAMVVRPPADPSKLINEDGVKQFMAWARKHFRWVIIDSAPVVPAADTTDLASLADAVIAVVRAHKTPRELSRRAFEMLGKRLHSVILNHATVNSNPYYRYLGKYYVGPSLE